MPAVRIRIRRDTSANWSATNPVLLAGELGAVLGSPLIKVGDGVTAWNSLAYVRGEVFSESDITPQELGEAAAGSSTYAARADHRHPTPSSLILDSLSVGGNAEVSGALTVTGNLIGGTHTHTASVITDFTEAVQDVVGNASFSSGSNGLSVTYNDTANTLVCALRTDAILDAGSYTGTNT